jgi:hypothetical protein
LESEIEETLKQIATECDYSHEETDKALAMMRAFYNGYSFTYDNQPLVYNPTLALYFFEHFQKNCQYPRNMLDSNLAMDRGKIRYISQLTGGEQVIVNAIDNKEPLTISVLVDRFGIEDMLHVRKDTTFMASLLYYFGLLTLKGTTALKKQILKISNLVTMKLYVEHLQETLIPDINESRKVAELFYIKGDITALCNFMETHFFKVFENRDYRWAHELTVKTAFLTLLFNDLYYIMDSETALDKSYADLTMIVRPDMRSVEFNDIVLEFKYVSLSDTGLSGEHAKKVSRKHLKTIPLVEQKLSESRSQLTRYSETLKEKYGDSLRLHCYSIVAVGFDRLVWVEV